MDRNEVTTRRRRTLAVGLAAALCATATTGAHASPSPLKHDLQKLVAKGVPGATVLVREGNHTSIVAAGKASLRPGHPMRKHLRFRIGSITKPMLATVVLQLVDERKLALDEPITEIVGDLAGGDARITVRDLLAHTSGLSEYTEDPRAFAPYLEGHFDHVWSPQQLIGFATDHKPGFVPGADVAYSNTNYVLLGLILEKVTGHTLCAELRARVFKPLHMDDSSVPKNGRIRGPHSNGYLVGDGGRLQDVTGVDPSVYWGAGNVVSTTTDVADFLDALLAGKLFSPARLAEMEAFEPMFPGTDYGLGLSRGALRCGPGVGHDGAVAGYLSGAMRMANGRTVVAMANSLTLDDRVGTKQAQAQFSRLVTKAACDG